MKRVRFVVAVALAATLGACLGASQGGASGGVKQANDLAQQNSGNTYTPVHGVEFNNYNNRQKLADNPSTILWCTFAWPIPSSPLVTVPIVGKLTSGTKRPLPTTVTADHGIRLSNTGGGDNFYTSEVPGPDGMYGASDPNYRYGFDPAGGYWDFTSLSMACTTQPTVYQRQSTTIVSGVDPTLAAAQKTAQAQLRAGDKAGAAATLDSAIKSAGGK